MSTPAQPAHALPTLESLLRDYLNPAMTVLDLAQRHGIPVMNLVSFFETPEFQAPLARLLAAIRARSSALAEATVELAVKAQQIAIRECAAIAESAPVDPDNPKDLSLRARLRDQSRKAANLVLRIAKSNPATPAAPTNASPSIPPPTKSPTHPDNTSINAQPPTHSTPAHPSPPTPIPRAA